MKDWREGKEKDERRVISLLPWIWVFVGVNWQVQWGLPCLVERDDQESRLACLELDPGRVLQATQEG